MLFYIWSINIKKPQKRIKMNKELKNFNEVSKRNITIAGRNDLKHLIRNGLFGFVKDAGA